MKQLKKALGFILCLFFFTVNVFSQFNTLEEMFSENVVKELNANNKVKVYRTQKNTKNSELSPATEFGKKADSLWTKDEEPLVKIEMVYTVNKIQKTDESSRIRTILQSVSKMQGMKYFSHRKNKIKTLYPEFYCVEKVSEKPVKIDDTFIDNIDGKEIIVFQEDNSFGKYFSKVVYCENKNEFGFSYTNITPVKIGFITGAEEENVKIFLLINQTEDKIVIYAKVEALVSKFPGILSMMEDSLTARAEAIAEWFIEQYHENYSVK